MGEATSVGSIQYDLNLDDSKYQSKAANVKTTNASLKDSLNTVANGALAMGTAITGIVAFAVDAAVKYQTANSGLKQSIQDVIDQGKQEEAATGASAAATQVLIDKKNTLVANITAEQDAITKATDKYGANSVQVQQAQNKLATYQTQLETVTSKINTYTQSLQDAGLSADSVQKQFDDLAEKNTSLGFATADSVKSFQSLFTVFKSVSGTTDANSIAMDLARAKGEDLATASQQVAMAYEGQGKALKSFGINIKDTATGQEALSELQAAVSGQATTYSKTFAGQVEVTKAKLEAEAETVGTKLLPILTQLITKVGDVVTKMINWADAHPQLVTDIVKIAAVLGPMLLLVGGGIKAFLEIQKAMKAYSEIMALVKTVNLEALLSFGLWLIAIAAVIFIVYEIITHWTQVKTFFEKLWNDITSDLTDAWDAVSDFFSETWDTISGFFEKYGLDILAFVAPFIGIPLLVIKNWSSIVQFFSDLWRSVSVFFGMLKDFFTGGDVTLPADRLTAPWIKFSQTLDNLQYAIKQFVANVIQWFKELPENILRILKDIAYGFGAFLRGIYDLFTVWIPESVKFLGDELAKIPGLAAAIWSDFIAGVVQMGLNFWNGLKAIGTFIKQAFDDAIQKTVDFANAVWNVVKEIPGKIEQAWNTVRDGVKKLWEDVINWFKAAPGNIEANAKSFADAAVNLGTSLYNGFMNIIKNIPGDVATIFKNMISGLGNLGKTLADGAKNVATGMWNSFKDGLGIHSPSYIEKALMAIQNQGASTVQSLTGHMSKLNMAAGMVGSFGNGMLGSNGGNGAGIATAGAAQTQNITIQAGAFMGNQADARSWAETLTRYQSRYNRQLGA